MCWNMPILDWEGSYLKEGALWSCILKPVWSLKLLFFAWDTHWAWIKPAGEHLPYHIPVSADNHSEKIQCKAMHSLCFLPQIEAPLVAWSADLRKRLLLFLMVTVNPLPGCWILKKIIATFCEDLMLLWIFPLSQKSTYLWEVVSGWSKELGNFSPFSIHPSNTYRSSII